MIRTTLFAAPIALGLSAALAMPVSAQQSGDYQQNQDRRDSSAQVDRQSDGNPYQDQRYEYNERRRDNRQALDNNRDQQRQRQNERQANSQNDINRQMQFDLDGWVTVATDYDRDGRFDAMETIYLIDLENARRHSQARTDQRKQRSSQSLSQQQTVQARGEIKSLQSKNVMHSDQPNVVAKLKTEEDRTATVCLGPKNKVSQLDLQEGDTIRVKGKRARMDGKSILMAQLVSTTQGQSIQNDLPKQRKLERIHGEIVRTRDAEFENRNATFVVATIRHNEHGTQQLNLGPKQDLSELNLKEGKTLKALAHPGRINGQKAMIAEVVHVDGKSVDVRAATKRTLQKDRGQQDRSQQNREMHREQYDDDNASNYYDDDQQDRSASNRRSETSR